MNPLRILFAVYLLLTSSGTAFAQVAMSADFQNPTHFSITQESPGGYATFGYSGDYEGANRYMHHAITAISPPPSSLSGWYVGSGATRPPLFSGSKNWPTDWVVSFDIRQSVVQPVQIRVFLPSGSTTPSRSYTGWATPDTTGWTHVEIDSTQFSLITGAYTDTWANMYVLAASHDQFGNALPMAQPGSYTVDLDNIALTIIPEPGSAMFMFLSLAAFVFSRPTREG